MATIVDAVDKSVPSDRRYQYWTSGVEGDAWSQGDVIDVFATLGRPAKYVLVVADSDCDVKVRFNSQVKMPAPLRDARYNDPQRPSIGGESIRSDTTMNAIPVGDKTSVQTLEWQGILPVFDIEIDVWTDGTFEVLVA